VACYDGGVFVGAAPDLLYLRDTDGDGVADERDVVFTGFGRGNVHGLLNSFQWGLDHRIYVAVSSSGGMVRQPGKPDAEAIDLRGRDFSFDPRKRDVIPITGGGQHGASFNRWGDRFVCSNSDHLQAIVLEDRYVAMNPFQAAGGARRSIAVDGPQAEVFRTSPVEPWRIARTKMRVAGLAPGPIEGGGRPAGYFTSATGVTIDEGGLFGESFALVADVGSNLIHRKRLSDDGVTYRGERIDPRRELVTSTDNWFRPVQMCLGPEGAIYVADMYREVIEHPQSLPPELKRQLDLTSGRERGRIYRLVPANFKAQHAPPLGGASAAPLVEALEHPNMWRRMTAARLLYERQDLSIAPYLRRLLAESKLPEARVLALYALSGLAALDDQQLSVALDDPHPQVRRHGLRLAESRLNVAQHIRAKAYALVGDPDVRVQFQLALSLGACDDPQNAKALAELIRNSDNPDVVAAALISAHSCAGELLRGLVADANWRQRPSSSRVIAALARQIQRQLLPEDVAGLVQVLRHSGDSSLNSAAAAILLGLGPDESAASSGAESKPSGVLAAAQREALPVYVAAAREILDRESESIAERATAIGILALGDITHDGQRFRRQLTPAQPVELQTATLQALRKQSSQIVADIVLSAWGQLTPEVREQAAELLCTREIWMSRLAEAIDQGRVRLADVSASTIMALTNSSADAVRKRVAALRDQAASSDRRQVFEDYRRILAEVGDVERGAKVFEQQCANCHQLGGRGHAIGPSLAAMTSRGAEALLYNILVPNGEMDPRYASYTVLTNDGRILSGIIAGESAASVTLKGPQDETSTVLRVDIDELRSTGMSMMPEGLERLIDRPAMADLLAYLQNMATDDVEEP
jgi:putative membrane-bound dehydrogenase-like protein